MGTTVMCASCGGGVSEARASLGMVTCSGPCNAQRRRETGLVDGVHAPRWTGTVAAEEAEAIRTAWETEAIRTAWETERRGPTTILVSPPPPLDEGRHPEWRRGFTAGLVVGLVVGLVLPLVALLGEPARADGPAPPVPGETCEDVVAALQGLVAAMEADAGDYSARTIRLTLRNNRLAERVEHKSDTIAHLRARLRAQR